MNSAECSTCAAVNNPDGAAILFENFLDVFKFNVITGEFYSIKSYQYNRKEAESCKSIYSYFRRAAETEIIHPDVRKLILRYMEPEYLADRLFRGTGSRRIIIHGLRFRILGEYQSVSIDICASKSFSGGVPWAVMYVSSDSRLIPDSAAVSEITRNYYKILYINLKSGSYEPVFMTESEIDSEESLLPDIREWIYRYACSGNVPNEELEDFLLFTDPAYIRTRLGKNEGDYRYNYRRRVCGEYKPAELRIVRCPDYSEDEPNVYGYICTDDPDGQRSSERRIIENYFSSCDIVTGMWNKSRYASLCKSYSESSEKETAEVLFAMLTADRKSGILTADAAVQLLANIMTDTFGRDKCYRIEKNEFAVISVGSGNTFSRRAEQFCGRVRHSEIGFVLTAYISEKCPDTVEEVLDKARRKAVSGITK